MLTYKHVHNSLFYINQFQEAVSSVEWFTRFLTYAKVVFKERRLLYTSEESNYST